MSAVGCMAVALAHRGARCEGGKRCRVSIMAAGARVVLAWLEWRNGGRGDGDLGCAQWIARWCEEGRGGDGDRGARPKKEKVEAKGCCSARRRDERDGDRCF